MVITPVIGFYEVALASAWPCSATLDYIFVSTGVNSRAVNANFRNLMDGDYDGRGQQTASPMLTAIMSGGVGISGRELYKYR